MDKITFGLNLETSSNNLSEQADAVVQDDFGESAML